MPRSATSPTRRRPTSWSSATRKKAPERSASAPAAKATRDRCRWPTSSDLNAKIRDFANQKTPYILVFGDKEEGAGAVSVRTRGKGDQGSMPLADFITKATALIDMQSTEL